MKFDKNYCNAYNIVCNSMFIIKQNKNTFIFIQNVIPELSW